MPKLYIADATGAYALAKKLYVADATGTFRLAVNGFVADSSGTYVSSGAGGPIINSFSVESGSPNWSKVNMSWSAINATTYEIYQVGSGTLLASTALTSATINVVPNTAYSFYLRAKDATGAYVDSAPVPFVTGALPAPASLRTNGAVTYNAYQVTWNAVQDATSYELQKNGVTVAEPSNTGPINAALVSPSSSYTYRVRAKLGSAISAWSSNLVVNTPAEPGPAAGAYTFSANDMRTWQTSDNTWRATADGGYHGNGSDYGSARGNQSTWFFYGSNRFDSLQGGTVTKFEINIRREDDAGASAAQSNRWHLHTMASKPGGTPLGSVSNSTDAGSLARGETEWVVLPTSWGQKLVDEDDFGGFNIKGIGWGNVSGRYMHALPLSGRDTNGRLRITIG